jgi:hypothetical protein
MDIYTEFLTVVDALSGADIDYAVCGGIAVAIHGFPRLTRDIDFLVQAHDWDRITTALRPVGYTLIGGPIPFDVGKPAERELRRLSKPQAPDEELLTLDFLLVAGALREAWETREAYEWQGRRISVVSRQGLMLMKRLAGRPQDVADLDRLGERG